MRVHPFFAVLVVAFVVWGAFALRGAAAPTPTVPEGDPTPPTPPPPPTTVQPVTVIQPVIDSVSALEVATLKRQLAREHRKLIGARARVRTLTRTLAHRTSTREAIGLACSVYGNCSTLWSLATCESGLYAYARNVSGATGLLQFMPGTWTSTPFGRFSIYSVYAQALAGGWMLEHGRRREWVC